jgi:hypothetical protein
VSLGTFKSSEGEAGSTNVMGDVYRDLLGLRCDWDRLQAAVLPRFDADAMRDIVVTVLREWERSGIPRVIYPVGLMRLKWVAGGRSYLATGSSKSVEAQDRDTQRGHHVDCCAQLVQIVLGYILLWSHLCEDRGVTVLHPAFLERRWTNMLNEAAAGRRALCLDEVVRIFEDAPVTTLGECARVTGYDDANWKLLAMRWVKQLDLCL